MTRCGAWLICGLLLGAAGVCALERNTGTEGDGAVTYDVTLQDGSLRHDRVPPPTRQGIQKVTRLANPAEISGIAEFLLGGREAWRTTGGQTVPEELRWDGQAWVGAADGKPEDVAAALKAEAERIKRLADRVEKGTWRNGPGRDEAVKALRELGTALPAEWPEASGELTAVDTEMKGAEAQGTVGKVETERTVPFRVQAWPTPAGAGVAAIQGREFTYTVQMRHALAGPRGAFYYVAYADTDGDGIPDKLVARSELAAAERPGGWTSWTFKTAEHLIFVGNAWTDEKFGGCFEEAKDLRPGTWSLVSKDVYVAAAFGAVPKMKLSPMPYRANIRVKIEP